MKKYLPAVLFLAVLETVAVTLWLTKENIFYLLNLSMLYHRVCISSRLSILNLYVSSKLFV